MVKIGSALLRKAVVLTFLASTPAHALVVYGSNGKPVGQFVGLAPDGATLAYVGLGTLQTGTIFHVVELSAAPHNGLAVNTDLFFSAPNCQGQAYAAFDPSVQFIPTAQFDGQTVWIVNTAQAAFITTESEETKDGCVTPSFENHWVAPAVILTNIMVNPHPLGVAPWSIH